MKTPTISFCKKKMPNHFLTNIFYLVSDIKYNNNIKVIKKTLHEQKKLLVLINILESKMLFALQIDYDIRKI